MDSSMAEDINVKGDVVGYSYLQSTGNYGDAFLALNGNSGYTMTDLGVPAGCNESEALGINKYDMVAGEAYNTAWQAYLWTTGVVPLRFDRRRE